MGSDRCILSTYTSAFWIIIVETLPSTSIFAISNRGNGVGAGRHLHGGGAEGARRLRYNDYVERAGLIFTLEQPDLLPHPHTALKLWADHDFRHLVGLQGCPVHARPQDSLTHTTKAIRISQRE